MGSSRRETRILLMALFLLVVVYCVLLVVASLAGCSDPCRTQSEDQYRYHQRQNDPENQRAALPGGRRAPHKAPDLAPAATGGLWLVTAYCPCRRCCGPRACGITASGKPAVGQIAAAPPEIPFGTVLDVPGYGRALVADRGAAIQGRRLDLLFPTHAEALAWGKRWLRISFQGADHDRDTSVPATVAHEPGCGSDDL